MTEMEFPTPPQNVTLEQYKAYFQDVGNIGSRHENCRRFYLSIVSVLFVFLSMTGEDGPFMNVKFAIQEVVGVFGLLLCIVWIMHMQSFAAIFRAKFKVLREIEGEKGLFDVSGREWKHLTSDPRYRCLTLIDSVIPIVFASLFALLMSLQ